MFAGCLLCSLSGVILRGWCCLFVLTVFYGKAEFNGDVSAWDVSSVTTLERSKCRGWEGRKWSMWLGGETSEGVLLLEVG